MRSIDVRKHTSTAPDPDSPDEPDASSTEETRAALVFAEKELTLVSDLALKIPNKREVEAEKSACLAKVDGLKTRLNEFKDPHAQLQWLHRKALRLKAKSDANVKAS